MKKRLVSIIFILVFFSGCGTLSSSTSSTAIYDKKDYSLLNNKLCGWGFHKKSGAPEFTQEQISQMKEYKCIYMEGGNSKNIYLTFDEGYENGYTSIILDVLRQKGVKAAFFVTGAYVKSNPELIKRMAKEGHIIGNHSLNHPSLPQVESLEKLSSELSELDRLVYGICKKRCRYLRPPKGEYSTRTLAFTKDLGYTNVFWSQAYVDWNDNVNSQTAFEKITQNLHGGCVLLLHAVSKGNADALSDVIDYARKEGYSFKSLDEYKY